jgi:hypothetical protein
MWCDISLLHAAARERLEVLESEAWDLRAAQRTESAGIAAARRSIEILAAAAGWEDGLRKYRADAIARACTALSCFVFQQKPSFSWASSRHPGAPRIPGRQAVAAVAAVLGLTEEGLRAVAGQHRVLSADLKLDSKEGQQGQEALMEMYANLSAIGQNWLGQTLPQRPEGPPPIRLISLLEESAVWPTFRALISLLATQMGRRNLSPVCSAVVASAESCVRFGARPLPSPLLLG